MGTAGGQKIAEGVCWKKIAKRGKRKILGKTAIPPLVIGRGFRALNIVLNPLNDLNRWQKLKLLIMIASNNLQTDYSLKLRNTISNNLSLFSLKLTKINFWKFQTLSNIYVYLVTANNFQFLIEKKALITNKLNKTKFLSHLGAIIIQEPHLLKINLQILLKMGSLC